jgi:hypothetical protein
LAELLGSAGLVIDGHGDVLDRASIDNAGATDIARQLIDGEELAANVRASSVGHGWLAAVSDPYTSLFGQDEHDLLDAYAARMRIALERREFARHVAASTAYLNRLVDAMLELGPVSSADGHREPLELRVVAR